MHDRSDAYHYRVIARAIETIEKSGDQPMKLDELASAMGMSSPHFQKVFSKWAGISPKRYQQFIVLDRAKSLLQENETTLGTANSLGLSSSSRLYDLFVRWEAMTPGEFARKGLGLTIRYGWFDSPFGDMLALCTKLGICGLAFAAECGRKSVFMNMASRWPRACYVEDSAFASTWTNSILEQKGETRLLLAGTPFQIKVWEALMTIPEGRVATYTEIARFAGNPKASRAAGSAIGRNPVSWLIPCHRVIRRTGALGGYEWGLPIKKSLLAWETARRIAG
ncbi:MAG: bifunctional helix-turn-helix domain-containing protein/methylated-DNA--[protein]-cysteine S-methyltransferase [Albidovulum sp.]|nr:bifunctional helix-turn-helix domain-containing protein/methylated-DNA--[protein]-cysteine S-methyltransferase [Albidovulum sp.]